jgi:hypothetical protein
MPVDLLHCGGMCNFVFRSGVKIDNDVDSRVGWVSFEGKKVIGTVACDPDPICDAAGPPPGLQPATMLVIHL